MVDIYKPNAVANFQHGHRREFLASMINQMNWTHGAELGIRTGQTFFHLLDNCPTLEKLYGIDSYPVGYEGWATAETQAAHHHEVIAKQKSYPDRAIILPYGTSYAGAWVQEPLDFIFIDADHTTEAVTQDIKLWAPKVKADGWVIGHDINWCSVYAALPNYTDLFLTGPDNCWAFPKAFLKVRHE